MTEQLDLATSFRINALLYVLMSLTTWLVLGRPRQWSVRVWCLAGLLAGVSIWLITLRGTIDDVWTYLLAQVMLLSAYLAYAQSMRMDIGRAWPWRVLMAMVLAYTLVLFIGFEYRQSPDMAVLVRVANSAALLALTLSALALARHERSRNALFMVSGFAIFTLSMLTNAILTWWGQAVLQAMQQWMLNHVMGLVSLFTVLMAYVGYLGLALERTQRTKLQLRQAQWQSQQWREQALVLSLLDRQRTLAVLANSLGHDILQPLTAARLNVQLAGRMLQARDIDAGLVEQVLARTVEGLNRSASLVGRIRGFLRPMQPQIQSQLLSLQSVVQDVRDLVRQELMYHGIELQVSLPEDDVCVQAQALPITQALLQVLRNAIRAVDERPQRVISVVLQSSEDEAWIEVRDSGPGLPQHVLTLSDPAAGPAVDWLGGLGLYMTRAVLEQFSGRLKLSNPVAGGACVRLVLPRAPSRQA